MRLTAKERILLHLLECGRSADEAEVSVELAQEGVAKGAGIEVRHLAQFVHPLIEEGLVRERRAHVAGIRQRRKVYALTPSGHLAAARLRDKVASQPIRIRDGDAVREGSLHEVLRGVGTKASLLQAMREVEEAGVLDLERMRHPPESGLVEEIGDAPQVTTFVGRRAELAEITREEGDARIFVVRGMAGIGKSTLAARACTLMRGRRNLFWHRIRPWESDSMVLAHVGRFLEALDRPALSSVLRRGEIGLASEVLRQDLPDTRSLLVVDDAHDASPQTLAVLQMVAEAVATAPDVKLLVLTRRALPFYSVRDIVVKGVVREIELDGLEPEEAASLLTQEGDEAALTGLGRRLGGHPLLIELVRNQRADIPAAIRDVHRFIEETVYRELSESEKTMMKVASLYRVPVPRASLLSIPGSSYEALTGLHERSLLRFVGDERYEIHDTIRDFFGTVLTQEESRRFAGLAVAELRGLAVQSAAAGDLVMGVGFLSNAVRLSSDPALKAEILENLGDAEARLGDLPATLAAYREAGGLVILPETLARLHRKIASSLQERGEVASASTEVEAALKVLGDRDNVERGWLSLVHAKMSIGLERWAEGRVHAEAALKAFRSFADERGQAEALIELAAVETNSRDGRSGASRECLTEALRLSRSMGDPALIANVHVQFANLEAYRLGNTAQAFDHLGAIEALPGALADVWSHESLLILKGWLNLDLRADFGAARANFEDAITLSTKAHDRFGAAVARYGATMAVYHEGDCIPARTAFEAVGREMLELGAVGPAFEALCMAAEICLVLGDLDGYRTMSARLKDPVFAPGMGGRPVLAHAIDGIDCLARRDREGVHAAFRRAVLVAEREASPQERTLIPFAHDLYAAALDAMGDDLAAVEEDRRAVESSEQFGLKGRLIARVRFMDGLRRSLRELFGSAAVSPEKKGEGETPPRQPGRLPR